MKKATVQTTESRTQPLAGPAAHSRHVSDSMNRIEAFIAPLIAPLGMTPVSVEIIAHPKDNRIRITIERIDGALIGIDDCVTVSHTVDEPLEKFLEQDSPFLTESYELEVSSPGLERPLRKLADYLRFVGRTARVHTIRPLTAEEVKNAEYHAKNPRQKNFVGQILSATEAEVELSLPPIGEFKPIVKLPFALITRAHVEPDFNVIELLKSRKREKGTR